MSEHRLKTKPKKLTDFEKDVKYHGLKYAWKKEYERFAEKYFWWRILLFLLTFIFIVYTVVQQFNGGKI